MLGKKGGWTAAPIYIVGGTPAMRIDASLQPMVALIAGILILTVPRLLNLSVAIYLIVFGLLGLMR